MDITRRGYIKLMGGIVVGAIARIGRAADVVNEKPSPRMPLDEFVKDVDLMKALRRGVRAMKVRKPSDPLSWFFQAAIHGVTAEMIQVAAAQDPYIVTVDQKKFWNQCPHFGQSSANFLPWHRAYTYYFERILRAHSGNPQFSLPYWDYSKPENYQFPREFGISKLDEPLDGDLSNPLWHADRNTYFTSWEHWSGNNLPYSQLTEKAVDWSPARDSPMFFGKTETEGLGGGVFDENSMTRGRLESFPHDPIHRLTGIIIPDREIPDPVNPGRTIHQAPMSLGMSAPPTAGFDPIFCIHHSNIDRLWAEWSCMPGKVWGNYPPQDWFDDAPWNFFDISVENGVLVAKEENKSRKEYFDYRALGISFKYEDSQKTPLVLPDEIPSLMKDLKINAPVLLARIEAPTRISGLLSERVSIGSAKDKLVASFEKANIATANFAQERRVLMRINGVNLGSINATGFDVHLMREQNKVPNRNDPTFVGSIALFRHDDEHIAHDGNNGADYGKPKMSNSSDTFDVTSAIRAQEGADPLAMFVVVVPFSLSATVDGHETIRESNSLNFESIDFLSLQYVSKHLDR